jgi:hypothetical protein
MEATTDTQEERGAAHDLPHPDAPRPAGRTPLTEGCCIDEAPPEEIVQPAMHSRARAARAGIGFAQLALGGTLATRKLPGGIALWPVALVPTWFGISHLIAAMIGYRGCPELGAIPTVMQGRPVGTVCEFWARLDRRLIPGEQS